ncbi:hypothetical protein V6N13_062426 [Hibiscus sabdariffa]
MEFPSPPHHTFIPSLQVYFNSCPKNSSKVTGEDVALAHKTVVFSLKEGYATVESHHPQYNHTHAIHVASLFPSSVCSSAAAAAAAAQGRDTTSSLSVVHKHGPCSQLHQERANIPTHAEILLQDQARVKSIHSKLAKNLGLTNVKQTDTANLPAKDGSVVGSGNYIVTVGLGTPKKDLSLIFDTGSDITWAQCEPCVRSCYKQKDPIFSPSSSSTYSNVSCGSAACDALTSATGNSPSCSSSACVYGIQYGDSSFSIGFFAKEKLTLTSRDVFNNFLFGCGQNNQGLFGGAAGLLGLGRDKLSLPSQTAIKYKKIFSYCLPSSSSSTGFLRFGNGGISKSVKFTTLSTIPQGESFYGINMIGISVGGKKLSISASVFADGGAIIDSGTVITRLPPTAYSALRSAFRGQMKQYPMAQPLSILDTCYDFSKYSSVTIPVISFFFSRGVGVPIDARGILYVNGISQVCLAFAGNSDDSDVAIFGNTQQKTLEVSRVFSSLIKPPFKRIVLSYYAISFRFPSLRLRSEMIPEASRLFAIRSERFECSSCNMGYLNSVLQSSSQVHAEYGPVSGGGLSQNGKFSYGYASSPGKRSSMEDFYETRIDGVDGEIVGLFGVFDGHGGARAAEYVKHNLFSNLIRHPKFISDTKSAIADAYNHTDSEFLKSENNQNRDAGSTASTAVLVGDRLLVANVGDSRAVICRGGSAFAVSRDHKPDQSDERQRIEDAGGFVMWAGTWRVGGVLAVSRAFGDRLLKQYVVADPEIQEEKVDSSLEFLILASDGLWDVVSNEEAVAMVKPIQDPELAAKRLMREACERGSADNITCVVVRFLTGQGDSSSSVST